jgi:hypothetical protein
VTILTMELSRREFVAAGAAAGTMLALDGTALAAGRTRTVRQLDFTALPDGEGWPDGWRTVGVANLRRAEGRGVLEAGSDVFPNDPRPVAFAVDCRLLDSEIAAGITELGSAPGVVLRRRAPALYYAAIYDTRRGALLIVRRHGAELDELASVPVAAQAPLRLALAATGAGPTKLEASIVDSAGSSFSLEADDDLPALQRRGDPGVLATAETLFPSDPNPVLPALGNLHLLPWGVQEGQAFLATPAGHAIIAEIRRRSTAAFSEIAVSATRPPRRSAPSVVAATTGPPVRGGAELHVASDLRLARRSSCRTRGASHTHAGSSSAGPTASGPRPRSSAASNPAGASTGARVSNGVAGSPSGPYAASGCPRGPEAQCASPSLPAARSSVRSSSTSQSRRPTCSSGRAI